MKKAGSGWLETMLLGYFVAYVGNILLTRLATSGTAADRMRPLTGLEILPPSMLVSVAVLALFIAVSGWWRDAHVLRVGRWRLPRPTRYTALSAVGSALILCTVPLSYTFQDVSIPFIQLLMRGDILLIAPLVDVLFGRRVRWWSWAALLLVAIAVVVVVGNRGGLSMPPLAIATVVAYTAGYFLRLSVMTGIAKSGDPATLRRYFVEEKLVALPLVLVLLGAGALLGPASLAEELRWGFSAVWDDPRRWQVLSVGVTTALVSIFASIVLLDAHENSYCVPLERSATLLAGILAAWLLHVSWGQPAPTPAEMLGAALLIGAVVLLTAAPRLTRR